MFPVCFNSCMYCFCFFLQTYKLSAIKSDMRYTTKSQLIKLSTNYTISKINLKISDIKRAKTVSDKSILSDIFTETIKDIKQEKNILKVNKGSRTLKIQAIGFTSRSQHWVKSIQLNTEIHRDGDLRSKSPYLIKKTDQKNFAFRHLMQCKLVPYC